MDLAEAEVYAERITMCLAEAGYPHIYAYASENDTGSFDACVLESCLNGREEEFRAVYRAREISGQYVEKKISYDDYRRNYLDSGGILRESEGA